VRGLSRAQTWRAAWWLAAVPAVGVPMLVQRHWLRETCFVAWWFAAGAHALPG
jgi:hypothetical protein